VERPTQVTNKPRPDFRVLIIIVEDHVDEPVVGRVLALRLGHVVYLASSSLDAAYADCRKASAATVALFR